MQWTRMRGRALLAAALLAVAVMPVAIADAGGHAGGKPASRSIAKRLKDLEAQSVVLAKQVQALGGQNTALERELAELSGLNSALGGKVTALTGQNAALETKVTALGGQNDALEGKVAALEARGAPASLPPSGPAGGDLTGTYPNPVLGPNTVGSANIADGSVQSADIFDGAVGSADIFDHSITRGDLGEASVNAPALAETIRVGPTLGTIIKAGEEGFSEATCPPGTRLLSGGWEWEHVEPLFRNVRVEISRPTPNRPFNTWQVGASVLSGPNNSLIALALCLSA
jgi:hypothetical protein